MEALIERREPGGQRIPIGDLLVELRPDGEQRPFAADALDMSVGGLSTRATPAPTVGSQLECRFRSPSDGATIHARCEVVWTRERTHQPSEFGLRFIELAPDAGFAIERMVRSYGRPDDRPVSLELAGVSTPIVAEIRKKEASTIEVEQELPFLRLGTGARVDGDRGALDAVRLRIVDSIPRLVLTVKLDRQLDAEPNIAPRNKASAIDSVSCGDAQHEGSDTTPDSAQTADQTLDEHRIADGYEQAFALANVSSNVKPPEELSDSLLPTGNWVPSDHREPSVEICPTDPGPIDPGPTSPATANAGSIDADLDSNIWDSAPDEAPSVVHNLINPRSHQQTTLLADDHTSEPSWNERIRRLAKTLRNRKSQLAFQALVRQIGPLWTAAALTLRNGGRRVKQFTSQTGGPRLQSMLSVVTSQLRRIPATLRTFRARRKTQTTHRPRSARARATRPTPRRTTGPARHAAPAKKKLRLWVLAALVIASLTWLLLALFSSEEPAPTAPLVKDSKPATPVEASPSSETAYATDQAFGRQQPQPGSLPQQNLPSQNPPPSPNQNAGHAVPRAVPQPDYRAGRIPAPTYPTLQSPARPPEPGTTPADSPYAAARPNPSARQTATTSPRLFGAAQVPGGKTFTLRMSQQVSEIRGAARADGFTVHIPNALSLDRAGPIGVAHPRIARSMIRNMGDHAELSIFFAAGRPPAYQVKAAGASLEITIQQ